MRILILYLRQAFCRHDWQYEEAECVDYGFRNTVGTKVAQSCRKCGWHRSYWKY